MGACEIMGKEVGIFGKPLRLGTWKETSILNPSKTGSGPEHNILLMNVICVTAHLSWKDFKVCPFYFTGVGWMGQGECRVAVTQGQGGESEMPGNNLVYYIYFPKP